MKMMLSQVWTILVQNKENFEIFFCKIRVLILFIARHNSRILYASLHPLVLGLGLELSLGLGLGIRVRDRIRIRVTDRDLG